MKNYMKLLSDFYPELDPHPGCNGPTDVYENIIWIGTPIPKSELDAHYIDQQKIEKIKSIDTKTAELISQGFSFDGNSFSLSERAQINWIAIKSMEASITFPLNITTKNDGQYALAQENLAAFSGTALATKELHLASGRALKLAVNNSTTQAELDAVVDNR